MYMKKLNKLLLAGAALSGALVPKVGAFADIKVNDIINEFATTVNKTAYDKIKDDIENTYAIKLDGFKWSIKNEPEYNRVKYYI